MKDYYPFGMRMDGDWAENTSLNNEKYQYNGIEYLQDHGLNLNVARYRVLDPSLGRWLGVDPKAELMMGYTPYNAMANNPISFNDPEGDIIPLLVGAAIGVIGNGIGNSFNNQGFFEGWGEAAFFGAFTAGAASAIGGIASGIASSSGGFAAGAFQAGAHATVGGAVSMGQGGSFGSGALSGGLSSVAGSFTSSWGTVGQYGVGAATGGLGSVIGGGNFWEGAVTGAIVTGLNHAAHALTDPIKRPPINPETNRPYLPGFPDAEYKGRKGYGSSRRHTWVDKKGRVLQWDSKKGEVEVYDKRGRNHQGGFDPYDRTRRISKAVLTRIATGYRVILPLSFPVCQPCIEWFLPHTHLSTVKGI